MATAPGCDREDSEHGDHERAADRQQPSSAKGVRACTTRLGTACASVPEDGARGGTDGCSSGSTTDGPEATQASGLASVADGRRRQQGVEVCDSPGPGSG